MSNLPRVGESLLPDETLEALARATESRVGKDRHVCPKCRTLAVPRGYDIKSGFCWWCLFPRLRRG